MPVHNALPHLDEAVQSILGQSRREPPYLSPTNSPQYFGTVIDNPATASPVPANRRWC